MLGEAGEEGSRDELGPVIMAMVLGKRESGLGTIDCVEVRAGLRKTPGSPFDGSSMISWYQSYERKLKLGLGGGRSGKDIT